MRTFLAHQDAPGGLSAFVEWETSKRWPAPARSRVARSCACPKFSPVDVVVFVAIALLLFGILRLARSLNSSSASAHVAVISTDPANLPYYAARSLLRIFIAFFLSVVFTFVYATAAARIRRARIVLIPILDILQSVPILGFLAITVTFFYRPVPGLRTRPGMRGDLRHLHLHGLEHDVQHVPLPDYSAGRAGNQSGVPG